MISYNKNDLEKAKKQLTKIFCEKFGFSEEEVNVSQYAEGDVLFLEWEASGEYDVSMHIEVKEGNAIFQFFKEDHETFPPGKEPRVDLGKLVSNPTIAFKQMVERAK